MPEGLPDVSQSPIAVYTAMTVLIVLAVATITDKGLGPISRAWYAFAKNRREAAAAKRAADYAELASQIENIRRQMAAQRIDHANAVAEQDHEIATMRTELNERDVYAIAHQKWDRKVLAEITRLGGNVPEPPPLWPADPT